MDVTERLAPALRHLASARTDLSAELLEPTRAGLNERRRRTAAGLDSTGVEIADLHIGAVPVRVYRGAAGRAPVVIYCHSGAFVLGNLDTDHRQCVEWARRAQCVVVSVDYRLAPENPYPAALDDVLAVLAGVAALGVDTDRVAIGGSSAGGALAASVAQRAADGSVPPLVFQLLHQPVLDDRPSPSKEEFCATPGFDGPACAQMWEYYLGGASTRWGAVPGAVEDLSGIAPTLITCSELDPLRDEAVDYALRLMWAGVPTELHVFPGAPHAFESFAPQAGVSQLALAARLRRLRQG